MCVCVCGQGLHREVSSVPVTVRILEEEGREGWKETEVRTQKSLKLPGLTIVIDCRKFFLSFLPRRPIP